MEPRQPADEPRREHRRHPRGRRPQLHDARPRAARALRHRLRRAGRREDLAGLPARRAHLHRGARRDAQPARGSAAARDGHAAQPVPRVDRRPAAGRRLRLGRRRRPGARLRGWPGRTRASATRRTVSTRRCSWRPRTPPRSAVARPRSAPTAASRSCRQAAGWPRRCGRRATSTGDWESVVDGLYARYGHYHWVHAINNTALVAAALYHLDGTSLPAICGVVQGGWDTDTNGAAVGSVFGALEPVDERWSAPLRGTVRELAALVRRDHARRVGAPDTRGRA